MENATSECISSLSSGHSVSAAGITITFCVLCVNVLKILTIFRSPVLKKETGAYIVSIAVANIIYSGTFVLFVLLYFSKLGRYIKHLEIVDTFMLSINCSFNVSLCLHLAIIGCDRYIFVSKPFYYMKHMTKLRKYRCILCIWIFTQIYFVIPLIFYRGDNFHVKCIILHPPIEYFILGMIVIGMLHCIICVCFLKIALLAFTRKKMMNARKQQQVPPNQVIISISNGKAAMKSAKFFFSMFSTFAVCNSVPALMSLMGMLSYNFSRNVIISSLFLFHIYSLVNFCIFINMNRDFREGLKKQFNGCKLICCKQRNHY